MARLTRDLTPEQRDIVEAAPGPVLVLAGVGCGKTRVLTSRVAVTLDRGVPARSILAITFTNRAAQEMRHRLAALIGGQAGAVALGTFHALCARILRRDGKLLAIEPSFVVWDEVDSRAALALAARSLGLPRDDASVGRYQARIRSLKARNTYPQNWKDPDESLLPLFREYQRLLTLSNALDFDDLIAQTRTLLGYFEGIRLKWTESYSWVAVDEFQDTSPAEYQLFHLLTKDHRTISAFGDTDQWIYRWRGVDGRKIVDRFRADFPGHVELSLDRNFRSTRAILDAAAGVIAGGRGAPARSVSGGAERGEAVRVRGCPTEQDELDYIARRVGELGRSGLGWSSIAVLTRTNARAEQVARALTSAAIPSVTAGATEFFRRPEVKDLAAYPRLIANRYADLDLRRVADVPPRGLPESYLHEVAWAGRARGLLLTDLVDDALLQDADPCGYEIDVAGRTHVALDDEIVEIAAFKVDGATGWRQDLRALIRPARSVGASRAVHGLSDAELAERGRDPISALAELRAFVGALPLVGHNITEYDLPLINANLRRVGLPVLANRTADTLWLARRALDLDRHDLDRVCARLGVPIRPSHRAADDAARAAACFQALTRLLTLSSERRRAIAARAAAVRAAGPADRPLARARRIEPAE